MLNSIKLNNFYKTCNENPNGLFFCGVLRSSSAGERVEFLNSKRTWEDRSYLENILLNVSDENVRKGIETYSKSLGPLYLIYDGTKVVGMIHIIVLTTESEPGELTLYMVKDAKFPRDKFLKAVNAYLTVLDDIYSEAGVSVRFKYGNGMPKEYLESIARKHLVFENYIYLNTSTGEDVEDAHLGADCLATQYDYLVNGDMFILRQGNADPFGFPGCSLWYMMSSGERMDQLIEGMKKYRKEHYKN